MAFLYGHVVDVDEAMPTITPLPIKDAFLVIVNRPKDKRGYFNELYKEGSYPDTLRGSIAGDWKQVAVSQTEHPNTIRGLHMSPYNKMCNVLSGAVYDVVVDMRKDSPTFLKWCGAYLSEANQRQVHIPAGCLHGFLCLEPNTRMLYLQGGTFSPELERDCSPFDPLLNIHWPLLAIKGADIIISDKDRDAPQVIHPSRFPELANQAPAPHVLIIGASGQVGSALVAEYTSLGYAVYGTHNSYAPASDFLVTVEFDLKLAATNQDAIDDLLAMTRPSLVVICSALTAVDKMESGQDSQEHVWDINVRGPQRIAAAASKMHAKVVAYSTEYVWDGVHGPYVEEDESKPINMYGQSKVDMETAVLAANPEALILRTTVVYGPEIQGKNFVYQLCQKLTAGQTMTVAVDQVSTPTYNRDLALMTRLLVDKGASGIFNACGPELMSRFDFALAIAGVLGLSKKELIKPIQTDELKQVAKRPLNAGMKIEKVLGVLHGVFKPRTVREALLDWMAKPGAHSLQLAQVKGLGTSPALAARL